MDNLAKDIIEMLPVMESFYTIQGEGMHSGKAAYFIRLAGCDIGCHWCDVKESWDVSKHPLLSIDTLVNQALEYPSRLLVVTGGEPLMHNLDSLCNQMHNEGFSLHIETSGAYALSGTWDWITLSPKKFKEPLLEVCTQAKELKIIVYNKSDFEFSEKYKKMVNQDCVLLLQPEWSKEAEILPLIIDYVKLNPSWRISLQTHKYMNVP